MKLKPVVRTFCFAAALAVLGAGCGSESLLSPDRTAAPGGSPGNLEPSGHRAGDRALFFGPAVPVNGGVARAWTAFDADGRPVAIGVDLTENAVERKKGQSGSEVPVFFHPVKTIEPYTHMLVGYNPQGHEPPGTYDVEHFDVHFYFQSNADREDIGPNDSVEFANEPDPKYLPADFMRIPGGIPGMGAHWIDLQAPEFTGGTFSRTFLWGSYDGRVTFIEPMITTDFLQGVSTETVPLRQPLAWERDGYYPAEYRITRLEKPGTWRISLEGLVFHQGE